MDPVQSTDLKPAKDLESKSSNVNKIALIVGGLFMVAFLVGIFAFPFRDQIYRFIFQRPPGIAVELPTIEYLGDSGTFTASSGSHFLVKRLGPFRFDDEYVQEYTAQDRERVWLTDGDSALAQYHAERSFGAVQAGCEISTVAIDDDVDDRINYWYINGQQVHEMSQGMVVYDSFTVPTDGELTLYANDSIAAEIIVNCAEPTPTPTPPVSACEVLSEEVWDVEIWRNNSPKNKTFTLPEYTSSIEIDGYWGWNQSPDQFNEEHNVETPIGSIHCPDYGDEEQLGNWLYCGTLISDWSANNNVPVTVKFSGDASSQGSHMSRVIVRACGAEPTPTPTPTPIEPASVGDYTWIDSNDNGQQDEGEEKLTNVRVSLYAENGTLLDVKRTDDNGLYRFDELEPACYYLDFGKPSNYTRAQINQGVNDDKDSDAKANGETEKFCLAAGEYNMSFDAGYVPIPDPVCTLGDRVWNDVNKNGIQDDGEAGMESVVVKLYDTANNLVATSTTNAEGLYSFANIECSSYILKVVTPEDYVLTSKDTGENNEIDSDFDPFTKKTEIITLEDNTTDITWDAGLHEREIEKASLGDYIWVDENMDGVQNDTENGIQNITVKLYTENGSLVATTTTNTEGYYLFDNLLPGAYFIEVIQPEGYTFSPKDTGNNNEIDSDVFVSNGQSETVTLAEGEVNLTLDAGIYNIPEELGQIGDYVWEDTDNDGIQDDDEQGVDGVIVKLLDQSDNVVLTTETNSEGKYFFNNISEGQYRIMFVKPENCIYTEANVGNVSSDDQNDSDADADTGMTASFVLDAGETDLSWDAGIVCSGPTPTPTTPSEPTATPTTPPQGNPDPTPTFTPTPSPTPLLTDLPDTGTREITIAIVLGLVAASGIGFFLIKSTL